VANEITNGRTLAGVVAELKDELKEFISTRIQMLQAELREKAKTLKVAAPLGIVALVLLGTAYLLFTLMIVSLIVVAFEGSAYQWFLAFLITGVLWSIAGGTCALFAWREFKDQGLAPKKTIKVLKEDQIWLQTEARTQL
jgi:uncharacterized membrane protein YqjE